MDWLNKNDDDLKSSILNVLIELSRVDNEVSGKELLYILDIGKLYNVDQEEIRKLLYEPKGPVVIPTSEKDRMTILYFMLFLMKMDGKVLPQEENIIFHYGFKLGFNESLIREMIVVIKEHLGKKLPPDELIKRVKKYLN